MRRPDRGLTAYTTLVTRRSVLQQKRDELLGMVRAMYRTLRWIKATPGGEIARVLVGYFPDVPPAILRGRDRPLPRPGALRP